MTSALTTMTATEVLAAIERHHSAAATVREMTIHDPGAHADYAAGDDRPTYMRRIDALMFSTLQRTAIEVKVSKADFRRESHAKTRAWFNVCHRFVYACPAGVVQPEDVALAMYPAGLWWVHDDGRVAVQRKAQLNKYPEPLPQNTIQNLAYRAMRAR